MGPPCGPKDGWIIIEGRLFCNINSDYAQRFANLGSQGVSDGDSRWAGWFGGQNSGPMNTGCYPGDTLQHCMNGEKRFPNRSPEPTPQPAPSPTPRPMPSPTPMPTPQPTPPAPSPQPSPSNPCAEAVESVCADTLGDWNQCFNCCLDNEYVVHPVCPSTDDLQTACRVALI